MYHVVVEVTDAAGTTINTSTELTISAAGSSQGNGAGSTLRDLEAAVSHDAIIIAGPTVSLIAALGFLVVVRRRSKGRARTQSATTSPTDTPGSPPEAPPYSLATWDQPEVLDRLRKPQGGEESQGGLETTGDELDENWVN
jgi:hypothetical protein